MHRTVIVRRRDAVVGSMALLASLLAALGLATPLLRPQEPALVGNRAGRVYGVAEVTAGLAQHPARWVGATVWVQGVLAGAHQRQGARGAWEIVAPPHLVVPVDPAMDVPFGVTRNLPVSWSAALPLWVWLRRLPLLGGLVPRPHLLQWDRLATYRVRLQVVPGHACSRCYDAVLLDVA